MFSETNYFKHLSYSRFNTCFPGSHIILEINSIKSLHASVPFLSPSEGVEIEISVTWVKPLTNNVSMSN